MLISNEYISIVDNAVVVLDLNEIYSCKRSLVIKNKCINICKKQMTKKPSVLSLYFCHSLHVKLLIQENI